MFVTLLIKPSNILTSHLEKSILRLCHIRGKSLRCSTCYERERRMERKCVREDEGTERGRENERDEGK